jgi:chromosome segregation ATPase
LLSKIQSLETELSNPQASVENTAAELGFLQTTVDDQKDEIVALRSNLQEMRDNHYLEVRDLLQKLEGLESPPDYSTVIEELKQENESLIVEIQSLRFEMQARDDAAVSTLNLLNERQGDDEAVDLKAKNDNLAMDLEESEVEAQRLKDELTSAVGKFRLTFRQSFRSGKIIGRAS